MWKQYVTIEVDGEEYEVECNLQEGDGSFGEEIDGNRGENQSKNIEVVDIIGVTTSDGDEMDWGFFCAVTTKERHTKVETVLREIVNKGELC